PPRQPPGEERNNNRFAQPGESAGCGVGHGGHTEEWKQCRLFAVVALVGCVPYRRALSQAPHHALDVVLFNRAAGRSLTVSAQDLRHELAAVLAIDGIEWRAVKAQHAAADLEGREMRAQENDADAAVGGIANVFGALDASHRQEPLVGCP